MDKRELIIELKTGKNRPAVARDPLLSSANTKWQGILLEHHRVLPFENKDVCTLNNIVVLHLAASLTLEWKEDGPFRQIRILPNQVTIVPAQMAHSARTSDSRGEFVLVSLEQRFLAYAASEHVDPDRLELMPVQGGNDALIEGICSALQAEAHAGAPGGRLYSDALGTALAAHLVQNYSVQQSGLKDVQGGLAKYQLRRAIDFIHDNLEKDISLNVLASAVGISPFHFARLFKQSTGLAPHQYLLRCRVERARRMLVGSDASIADIAVRLGFCDQSHLALHFKRVYGVTPKKFLREMSTRKILTQEASVF